MKISPVIAWYDAWVGVYWDRRGRKLYWLPLPCIGLCFDFGGSVQKGLGPLAVAFRRRREAAVALLVLHEKIEGIIDRLEEVGLGEDWIAGPLEGLLAAAEVVGQVVLEEEGDG